MAMIDGLLQELEQEAQTTKRVLERVPDAQLGWKPHAKSMTLGQLAMHIAIVPGGVAEAAAQPSIQRPLFEHPSVAGANELVPMLDDSVKRARRALQGLDDNALMATWRVLDGDREILAMPRIAFIRSVMLNHWYHHRGQLSVYLRQLNVPVPSIYGPSADENVFGMPQPAAAR
jgi:uncharacterized damage-inducible protein DinB